MAGTNQPMLVRFRELANSHSHPENPSSTSSEAPSNCPICSQTSVSRSSLLEHMAKTHNEQLVAVCKACRQAFSADTIQDHVVRCKGSFICPHCRATFACASYLRRHIKRKHGPSLRPTCDICGKSFSSTSALSYHKQSHKSILNYSCDLCNASFSQNCNLKTHIDSHHAYVELLDAPKPFVCDTCGRGFLFACSLQHHRQQHVSFPKKLSCPICPRHFAFRSELARHLVLHSRQRTKPCPICLRRFSSPSHLKYHILRHVNPDVFTCQYCFRTFSSRVNLIQHMRTHDSQSPILEVTSDSSPILLGDDCSMSLENQEALVHEALLDKYDDVLLETAVQSDLNLLHSMLFGSEIAGADQIAHEQSNAITATKLNYVAEPIQH